MLQVRVKIRIWVSEVQNLSALIFSFLLFCHIEHRPVQIKKMLPECGPINLMHSKGYFLISDELVWINWHIESMSPVWSLYLKSLSAELDEKCEADLT